MLGKHLKNRLDEVRENALRAEMHLSVVLSVVVRYRYKRKVQKRTLKCNKPPKRAIFGLIMGQIGTACDKSGTFEDKYSIILLFKKYLQTSQICPSWFQSDPLWYQIRQA